LGSSKDKRAHGGRAGDDWNERKGREGYLRDPAAPSFQPTL
jgi:hypothetical protein